MWSSLPDSTIKQLRHSSAFVVLQGLAHRDLLLQEVCPSPPRNRGLVHDLPRYDLIFRSPASTISKPSRHSRLTPRSANGLRRPHRRHRIPGRKGCYQLPGFKCTALQLFTRLLHELSQGLQVVVRRKRTEQLVKFILRRTARHQRLLGALQGQLLLLLRGTLQGKWRNLVAYNITSP